MELEAMRERPAPRTSDEIVADLRALAQSDGALHEISTIIYRGWPVTVDTQEGRIIDDPEYRWSTSRLNKNELMLLRVTPAEAENPPPCRQGSRLLASPARDAGLIGTCHSRGPLR